MKCGHTKAAHAFALIALDAREISEFAATVDPSHTRRDDVCRACRGDEKRAQSRDRVSAEAGMTMKAINDAKKAGSLSIVPSPATSEKHDRASDTPTTNTEIVEQPQVTAQPPGDAISLKDWIASGAEGAWRHNQLLVICDGETYRLLTKPAGMGPGVDVPGNLVEYLIHALLSVKPSEPLKGYVYA
jgi:hypothetical protein